LKPRSVQLRELLERLVKADIDFVLVGAFAVNAWGYLRGTEDIDVVPNPERENLSRLIEVLEQVGGRVKVDDDLLDPGSVGTFIRTGDKAYVVTQLGDVDVLQGLPQVPRFEELAAAAKDADLEGVRVRVCSLEHLVAMKRAADRPMDRIDLDALKTAHPEAFEGE
jgi:hypothetical protein